MRIIQRFNRECSHRARNESLHLEKQAEQSNPPLHSPSRRRPSSHYIAVYITERRGNIFVVESRKHLPGWIWYIGIPINPPFSTRKAALFVQPGQTLGRIKKHFLFFTVFPRSTFLLNTLRTRNKKGKKKEKTQTGANCKKNIYFLFLSKIYKIKRNFFCRKIKIVIINLINVKKLVF